MRYPYWTLPHKPSTPHRYAWGGGVGGAEYPGCTVRALPTPARAFVPTACFPCKENLRPRRPLTNSSFFGAAVLSTGPSALGPGPRPDPPSLGSPSPVPLPQSPQPPLPPQPCSQPVLAAEHRALQAPLMVGAATASSPPPTSAARQAATNSAAGESVSPSSHQGAQKQLSALLQAHCSPLLT